MFQSRLSKKIDELSVIARQCVAAVCFERYCEFHRLENPDISAFIDHIWLVGKLDPDHFEEWERGFQMLRASGWGEDLPEDVLKTIPLPIRQEYIKLAGYVIETSAATWYGSDLKGTKKYLLKVIHIVSTYGIKIPDLDLFKVASPQIVSEWGNNPSAEELHAWRYQS